MIRTAFKSATLLTGYVLVGSSVLHADSVGPTKHASSEPSVTTYATGLTNPRGLAFGRTSSNGPRRWAPAARSTSTFTAPTRPATAVA